MIVWTLWIDNNDWEFKINWLKENWKFAISLGSPFKTIVVRLGREQKEGLLKCMRKHRCSSISWLNNGVRKDWHIIWNFKVTNKCKVRHSTWHNTPPTPPLNFTRLLFFCPTWFCIKSCNFMLWCFTQNKKIYRFSNSSHDLNPPMKASRM
jgi:hypothetical protein